jgi:enoyl-CoA hydratase/carnithine racemase
MELCMAASDVSYMRRGRLGLIRLERPETLNALTLGMIAEVEGLARAAESDPSVTGLCITGAGRGFCSGLDMSVLADHAAGRGPQRDSARDAGDVNPALFSFLLDISKPVIAAVNGVGAGGGFILAMMCDLRFMAEGATLTTVFSRRGLIAEHGSSWLLPRMIGLSRALDLLWSSRKVGADEALRIGLADRVTAPDALLDAVEGYVEDLARTTSPRALALMKRQAHRHLAMSFKDAARETDALMAEALAHPDAAEGAASFTQRRSPNFDAWIGDST